MGVRANPISPAIAGYLPFNDSDVRMSWWLDLRNAYLDTWKTDWLRNGLGFNGNGTPPGYCAEVYRLLALAGMTAARTESSWNHSDPDTFASTSGPFYEGVQASVAAGLRPNVLVNSDTSYPAATRPVVINLSSAGAVGATTLAYSSITKQDGSAADANTFAVDRTTVGVVNDYYATLSLVSSYTGTPATGGTLTLSRPLQVAMPAGYNLCGTFVCKPFRSAGTADYIASRNAFLSFVDGTCAAVEAVTGNRNYSLEILNEVGNLQFLDINNYYSPAGAPTLNVPDTLFADVQGHIHATRPGVQVVTGYTNTSLFEPSGRTADVESIHPYAVIKNVSPGNSGVPSGSTMVLPDGSIDATRWTPTATFFFPEWYLTALQVESETRLIGLAKTQYYGSPINRDTWGCKSFWNTENGFRLEDYRLNCGVDTSGWTEAQAEQLKAKALLRLFLGSNHAGLERMFLYTAFDGEPGGFGFLNQSLIPQITPGSPRPPSAYTFSPFYNALSRLMQRVPACTRTLERRLWLTSVSDTHDHVQFAGDGTAARPPLYDRDVVRFLPYQATDHSWVAMAYVETRNMGYAYADHQMVTPVSGGAQQLAYSDPAGVGRYDLPAEAFDIVVAGVNPTGLVVTAYDPLTDTSVPVPYTAVPGGVTLHASLTDSPRIISLQEGPSSMLITFPFDAVDDNGNYVDGITFNTSALGHTPGIKSFTTMDGTATPITPLPSVFACNTGTGDHEVRIDTETFAEGRLVLDLSGGAAPFTGTNRYRKLILTHDSGRIQAALHADGGVDASASVSPLVAPLQTGVANILTQTGAIGTAVNGLPTAAATATAVLGSSLFSGYTLQKGLQDVWSITAGPSNASYPSATAETVHYMQPDGVTVQTGSSLTTNPLGKPTVRVKNSS